MDLSAAKDQLCDEVDARADLLLSASHDIHARPELGYEETFAHELLTDILEQQGLAPERGAFGLPTAFAARAGTDGPTIAVFCEYDALPGIGHACGHNIIATAGLGAGLAAARLADDLGGRLLILGSPAEEGGGGKVKMLDAGALDGVDAALMVHPAGMDLLSMNVLAVEQVWVTYTGQAAHAAAFPEKGRNALDAAVLGYLNVAALRQHIQSDERVHGIFTDAGDQPNIVPATAAARWYVRSTSLEQLEPLKARVLACLQAGADAAGCEMAYEWKTPVYADMVDNVPMLERYVENAHRIGRDPIDPAEGVPVYGSTDMGNVSYEVPSIHPMIKVAPDHVSIHTPEFAGYAASADGDRAVLDGAKMLALTIADLWAEPGVLDAARQAFAAGPAGRRSAAGAPSAPA
jgi:amidohydrolase